MDAAKARRAEIVALSDEYRAHYRSAYRALRAMGEVESERRVAMHAQMDLKLRRRTDGISHASCAGEGEGSGRVDRALLSAVTKRGDICRFDTVEESLPRAFTPFIDKARETKCCKPSAGGAGETVRRYHFCPNPDRPEECQHVLIPERGLAFVTTNARMLYEGSPHRRLRLDAMAEEEAARKRRSCASPAAWSVARR